MCDLCHAISHQRRALFRDQRHLGRYLEALAKGETGDVIRRLIQIAATTAILVVEPIENGASSTEEKVDIQLIQRGDVIRVLPGTRIPTD